MENRNPAIPFVLQYRIDKKKQRNISKDIVIVTLYRPFPECSDKKPDWFTPEEREQMRTGCLFECVSRDNFLLEAAAIALVIPSNPELLHMEFCVMMSRDFFQKMSREADWRCTPIGSVIGQERQYAALCSDPEKTEILDPLMGKGKIEKGGCTGELDNDAGLPPDSTREFDMIKYDMAEMLNTLNQSQEKGVSSFLEAPPGSISIIQGPPGTGKTTLLVSTICRFLSLSNVSTESRPRLLVCAPTNKAVSVLALRFQQMAQGAKLRMILVGDDNKLLEDSGGKKGPLYPHFVYHWFGVIRQTLREIQTFCNQPMKSIETMERMLQKLVTVRDRLFESLPDLTQVFKKSLEDLCTIFQQSVRDRTELPVSARDIILSIMKHMKEWSSEHVRTQILNSADVIFSTLCSAGGSAMMKMTKRVDALIVDEAAAATEPDMYIPLLHEPSKMLIVGDPKQLPATVISQRAKRMRLDVSLQERLMEHCNHPFTLLDIQYRMHPAISQFPSAYFYLGRIKDGENVLKRSCINVKSLMSKPYQYCHVTGVECTGSSENSPESLCNPKEGGTVVGIVKHLWKNKGGEWCNKSDHLRIITFYQAQVLMLRRKLSEAKMGKVLVTTVDSAQGCEADVIILSFVRTGPSPGFLVDDRRMNVALTRARRNLICVGNVLKFPAMRNAPTLHSLSRDAKERNVVQTEEDIVS